MPSEAKSMLTVPRERERETVELQTPILKPNSRCFVIKCLMGSARGVIFTLNPSSTTQGTDLHPSVEEALPGKQRIFLVKKKFK